MNEKINELLERFGSFHDLFCEVEEADIKKAYEKMREGGVCDEGEGADEDKMNQMHVMMECMGLLN